MKKTRLLKDGELARSQFQRYSYLNQMGHLEFMAKARVCNDRYMSENHWDPAVLNELKRQNRPALTINRIQSIVNAVAGEQLNNRAETMFREARDGQQEVAETLTKLSRQIDNNNDVEFVESEVFSDGIITGRGYFDARIDFNDSMQGEVRITKRNPINILPDTAASDYNPEKWRDVIETSWVSLNEVEQLYGSKFSDKLSHKALSGTDSDDGYTYGLDSINHNSFTRGGGSFDQINTGLMFSSLSGTGDGFLGDAEIMGVPSIRLIDRQYRLNAVVEYFVDRLGNMRRVPDDWDRARIAAVREKLDLNVITKLDNRIRWTVSADDVVLFDEWSPYRQLTTVPFFPQFRYGQTGGIVEHILDAQDLLNKSLSQELHIVNSTANGGWMVEEGSLINMDTDDLAAHGAKTGLVVEYAKGSSPPQKIQPNQIPTGLDRLSQRADSYISEISTISDSVLGQDRADVSAKAIDAKTARTGVNLASVMDNLERTRQMLAKVKLNLIQNFYTEERVIRIVGNDPFTAQRESVTINEVTPEGTIINDLTVGEYDVVITSVPAKDSFHDTQFDEAVRLKELGVELPDTKLIEHSHLSRKTELIQEMTEAQQDPNRVRMENAKIDEAIAKAQMNSAEAQEKMAQAEKLKIETAQELRRMEGDAAAPVDVDLKKLELQIELERTKQDNAQRTRDQESTIRLRMEAARFSREMAIRESELELKRADILRSNENKGDNKNAQDT